MRGSLRKKTYRINEREHIMGIFRRADILMPQTEEMDKWAVIACDQFTSEPEYWQRVSEFTADAPSALRLILPEAQLGEDNSAAIAQINRTMAEYLSAGVLAAQDNCYVYVERTLADGSIRKGVVGMIDLEEYDYSADAVSPVRATEKTVVERIPPRVSIRRDAPLELPHVLLLCDDEERGLIEPVTASRKGLPVLYDFDLMEGGGHIRGYLMNGLAARMFDRRIEAYEAAKSSKYAAQGKAALMYAVGDGNHSLASAKACWEELKKSDPAAAADKNCPARFALAELVNIRDEAQCFEPIHRVVSGCDPEKLLAALKCGACAENGMEIKWYSGSKSGSVTLDPSLGELPIAVLQSFLDSYLAENAGEIDYIHDDDALIRLSSAENTVGFALPAMAKADLFRGIAADGVLPRKTFSMGHAREKRYYLEARKIK